MRKHTITKYLMSGIAAIMAMTCQSCQCKSSCPERACQPKLNLGCEEKDEGDSCCEKKPKEKCFQKKQEKGCKEGCNNDEIKVHVIEIEPEDANVTEEKAPATPVREVPAEAPMEASTAPVTAPVEALDSKVVTTPEVVEPVIAPAAIEAANTPIVTETTQSSGVVGSIETIAVETQNMDAASQK
ncbi:MAG TPA: hypothetical protein VGO47_06055 [Chlamydiales bacterium]|jgi:hypothetical protein|nr:hypothetical protein [Chlamydiales bacterium]